MKSVFNHGRTARDGESRPAFDKNNQAAPVTDCSYQAVAPFLRGGAGSFGKSRASFRAFRALGNDFFEAEAKREDRIEAAIFAVIVAMSVWPIALAAQAAWHLIH